MIAPYRRHSTTVRYLRLLRKHSEGLTAQHIAIALGVTRQATFLMLHVLARRGIIECVPLPTRTHYGGRAYILLWRLIDKEVSPCPE